MATITQNITRESYPIILCSPSPQNENSHGEADDDEEVAAKKLYGLLPPLSTKPTVLEIDRDTPDNHVPRDPRLIRLTGVHPFNSEAPLTELFNEGW